MEESRKISFKFHPKELEKGLHAVEKSEGGRKRRYLLGISSGMSKDLHGERMTEACINSFQEQANAGDILLYEGQHGVNFVDDIGKLVHSEITPVGDWLTEYRLYDELDGFDPGSVTLEKADKLWKQVNGFAPYTRPKEKGFSIEGDIPDGGIISVDPEGRRVMNAVRLDGVVVVPRPAYKTSIASAVYKALGEIPPEYSEKIRKGLHDNLSRKMQEAEAKDNYYQKKYMMESQLEDEIYDIITNDRHGTSAEKLRMLFDEYSALMINLILQNEGLFKRDPAVAESNDEVYQSNSGRKDMLMQLEAMMEELLNRRGVTHE